MQGIPISQLTPSSELLPSDQIPIARGGLAEATRRVPGLAVTTTGQNIGVGTGIFAQKNLTTLQFYTLSCLNDSININLINNTIVLSIPQTVKTVYTGNGVTTIFSVANAISNNVNDFRVDIDGVIQEPTESFTLSASNIIFAVPPPAGTRIVAIYGAN